MMIRYLQKKEQEQEPSKVTLQISAKGIKLVAECLRHFVPSHGVTYVSQGEAPDDDIVAVIMLLYNPITKCPVHLHAYRCDSPDTATLLRHHFQTLIDLPTNQKKIRELEHRLESHGLYPSSASKNHRLLKSSDTGVGARLHSAQDDLIQRPHPSAASSAASGGSDPSVKFEQERIAGLYDSLAAELRDKLNGALSGRTPPLLLPPKDYEQQLKQQQQQQQQQRHRSEEKKPVQRLLKPHNTDNGSSSGLSSGIGSDLDDSGALNERSKQRNAATELQLQPQRRRVDRPHEERPSNLRRKDSVGGTPNCRSLDFGSCADFTSFQSTHNVKSRHISKTPSDASRVNAANRLSKTRSFHEENGARGGASANAIAGGVGGVGAGRLMTKPLRRCVPYQEMEQKDRFPGLDRDTARLDQHHLQRHIARRNESVPVVVEPLGKNHFRAVRQPN